MDESVSADVSLSEKLYMLERNEWDAANRDLRQHGLPAVDITHPALATKHADIVVLSSETCRQLRQSIQTLVRDCDRRQELIQELILTNNQLREELKAQTHVAEKLETKNKDLKYLIESSRSKLQNLQDLQLSTSTAIFNESGRLHSMTSLGDDTHFSSYQQRPELSRSWKSKEERTASQPDQILSQVQQRTERGNLDDRLLDMVNSYEREIASLRKELEIVRKPMDHLSNSLHSNKSLPKKDSTDYLAKGEAVPNFKSLIKGYEKQLRENKKKYKELENSNEILKLELQARPELKDLRECQLKARKLQTIMKQYTSGRVALTPERTPTKNKRATGENILNPHQAHILEEVCRELDVVDENHILPALHNIKAGLPRLKQFAEAILLLVATPGVPVAPGYEGCGHGTSRTSHAVWCEKTWQHVLPTLEFWADQLKHMKELQTVLNNLVRSECVPKQHNSFHGDALVTNLIDQAKHALISDQVIQDQNGEKVKFLEGVVEHFQELFSVDNSSGIYPRMNDIYSKLGEVHNIMKTLRDLLGLDEDAASGAVIEAVARLCQAHNSHAARQIKNSLFVDNVHLLAEQMEEQEEFLSVFQPLLLSLLEVLDVNEVDQILPAIKALRVLSVSPKH